MFSLCVILFIWIIIAHSYQFFFNNKSNFGQSCSPYGFKLPTPLTAPDARWWGRGQLFPECRSNLFFSLSLAPSLYPRVSSNGLFPLKGKWYSIRIWIIHAFYVFLHACSFYCRVFGEAALCIHICYSNCRREKKKKLRVLCSQVALSSWANEVSGIWILCNMRSNGVSEKPVHEIIFYCNL